MVEALYMETFKVKVDSALSNLIQLAMSLLTAGCAGLDVIFKDRSNLIHSMIPCFYCEL